MTDLLSDEQWGTALLCHSTVGETEADGVGTDSHDLSNRTGHMALVRSALMVTKAATATATATAMAAAGEADGGRAKTTPPSPGPAAVSAALASPPSTPALRSNMVYYECTVGTHKSWRLGWMQVKLDASEARVASLEGTNESLEAQVLTYPLSLPPSHSLPVCHLCSPPAWC